MVARDVLRSLSKEQSYEDRERVRIAKLRCTQEAKRLALSQASQEHAVPLAASLEMNRIQHLVRECAEIPQLHGLRWGRVADIMPQPYRNNAQGQFPGGGTLEIHASSTLCASASFMCPLCASACVHLARSYHFCPGKI